MGLHGQNTGDGYALLLAAAQKMGTMFSVNRHIDPFQGIADALLDFLRRHAQIFRAKGYVLFYDGGDDLVVRILKNHAYLLPYIPHIIGVVRPQPAYFACAVRRRQQHVEVLCQRRLARAVRTDDGDKFSRLNRQGYIFYGVDRLAFFILIRMAHMVQLYHRYAHDLSPQ